MLLAVLQAGNRAGTVKVTAFAEGLASAVCEIELIK
jgi:hypothetical protein